MTQVHSHRWIQERATQLASGCCESRARQSLAKSRTYFFVFREQVCTKECDSAGAVINVRQGLKIGLARSPDLLCNVDKFSGKF